MKYEGDFGLFLSVNITTCSSRSSFLLVSASSFNSKSKILSSRSPNSPSKTIDKCTDHDATVCDPACGSGSLLIRALAEVPFEISGYGQEKESSTAGLAKMNAVLHNKATIKIMAGNCFKYKNHHKLEGIHCTCLFKQTWKNIKYSIKVECKLWRVC